MNLSYTIFIKRNRNPTCWCILPPIQQSRLYPILLHPISFLVKLIYKVYLILNVAINLTPFTCTRFAFFATFALITLITFWTTFLIVNLYSYNFYFIGLPINLNKF